MIDSTQQFIQTLMRELGIALPNIVSAILIFILGLILASIVKNIILFLLKKLGVDEKIDKKIKKNFRIDKFIANVGYYLLLIYTLLVVMGIMGVDGVLAPLSGMLDKVLLFVPNIFAAGIIVYVGYVLAKLASGAVSFLSSRIVDLSKKAGLKSSVDIAGVIGQLTFLVIFVPIIIIALDTMNMEVISKPASAMLEQFMGAIPKILGAAVILAVFFIGGRFVVHALTELLKNMNIDELGKKLHLTNVIGEDRSMAKLIGNIAFFFICFAGVIAAVEKLEMVVLSKTLNQLMFVSGEIFLGLVILAIGNFLAEIAFDALKQPSSNKWIANIARFAIWGLFISIALNTMGIGEDIVNLAFALTLGAAAVAFALAFGLGGRSAAGKFLDNWLNKSKDDSDKQ